MTEQQETKINRLTLDRYLFDMATWLKVELD